MVDQFAAARIDARNAIPEKPQEIADFLDHV